MAKQTITRKRLYQIEKEFLEIRTQNPGLAILLEPKIQQFERLNRLPLQVMHARFNDIKMKYVQRDDQGNFKTYKKDDTILWQFVDRYNDISTATIMSSAEVAQRFEDECNALFNQSVTIDY